MKVVKEGSKRKLDKRSNFRCGCSNFHQDSLKSVNWVFHNPVLKKSKQASTEILAIGQFMEVTVCLGGP